jgi:hypothetical protein
VPLVLVRGYAPSQLAGSTTVTLMGPALNLNLAPHSAIWRNSLSVAVAAAQAACEERCCCLKSSSRSAHACSSFFRSGRYSARL